MIVIGGTILDKHDWGRGADMSKYLVKDEKAKSVKEPITTIVESVIEDDPVTINETIVDEPTKDFESVISAVIDSATAGFTKTELNAFGGLIKQAILKKLAKMDEADIAEKPEPEPTAVETEPETTTEPIAVETEPETVAEPTAAETVAEPETTEPESAIEKTKKLLLSMPTIYQKALAEVLLNSVDKDSVLLTLSRRVDDLNENLLISIVTMLYNEFEYIKTHPFNTADDEKWVLFEVQNNILHLANSRHLLSIVGVGKRLRHHVAYNTQIGQEKLREWEEKILNSQN